MSKEITYILPYREKGKAKTAELKISFVSNRSRNRYESILRYMHELDVSINRVKELLAENVSLGESRPEGYIEKIKDNQSKIQFIVQAIDKEEGEKKLQERFSIIKQILEDNGIEDFQSYKFWDEQTEPSTLNEFLAACYEKDNSKKKVM